MRIKLEFNCKRGLELIEWVHKTNKNNKINV